MWCLENRKYGPVCRPLHYQQHNLSNPHVVTLLMEIDADVKDLIYESYEHIQGRTGLQIWAVIAEPNSNSMAVTTSVVLCVWLTWCCLVCLFGKLWCSSFVAGSSSHYWKIAAHVIVCSGKNRDLVISMQTQKQKLKLNLIWKFAIIKS